MIFFELKNHFSVFPRLKSDEINGRKKTASGPEAVFF